MKRIICLLLCLTLGCALSACGGTETPETDTQAADYFSMVWGWECPAGKYESFIDRIYHTESGTAGSSGKAALSAVALLEFSNAYSEDFEELEDVYASMNDAQARFFASQWIRLRLLAGEALNDPEEFRKSYEWAGLEDFDASPYSMDKVNQLEREIAFFLSPI